MVNGGTWRRQLLALMAGAAAGILMASSACDGDPGPALEADGAARSARAAAEGDLACTGGSGAHDAHGAFQCAACHACPGKMEFGDVTLPGGTTTSGGVMVAAGLDTTCTVSCHSPFGKSPVTLAWNTPGPLACNACHDQGTVSSATGSRHPGETSSPVANRTACQSCHAFDQHTSGHVRIALADGNVVDVVRGAADAALNPACTACHTGSGTPLAGLTPPLLVDWTSPGGDFHGDRAGTGYGGTLRAPYARGQGALACAACHDAHSSANPYLFTSAANGTPIAAGAVDRNGVGAQALCEGCHQGTRHQGCVDCHGVDPMPAGSPCFACHGHEGIVNFAWPSSYDHQGSPPPGLDCTHCHVDWLPAFERAAPAVSNLYVKDQTAVSATVVWDTNEPATSYVEWGLGAAGNTTGSYALATHHEVTLTGLAGTTTYQFRVRTSDRWRNLTKTALASFQTASADAPPAPVPVDQGEIWTYGDVETVTLRWSAVADPQGDPVEYQVAVSDYADFRSARYTSSWTSGTSQAVTLPSWMYPGPWYFWRVQARDAAHDLRSPWSGSDAFGIWFNEY